MMEDRGGFESFSLLGGPLHKLGTRLGLVRRSTNTVPLGLALGFLPWVVLLVLAVLQGLTQDLFSLSAIGAHLRLLVSIPLFFLCESWLDPRWNAFVRMAVSSGVVPEEELPALRSAIARTHRLKDSWLAEGILLLVAFLLPWMAVQGGGVDTVVSRASSLAVTDGALGWVNWWFLMVCLGLFRFLMFRWLWRIGLWCYFLWRVARLDLDLVPTHPDGVAGLGYLEVVQVHFTPLIVALSVIPSAMVADGIASGAMTIEAMTPSLAWILILDLALFAGPLFLFTPKLWACRMKGLRDYMELAAHYVTAFDRKWLDPKAPPGEPLLGTPDLQSLADLSGSVAIVRTMRWAPVSLRLFATFVGAALLPIMPLLLIQYPAGDLVRRLVTSLIGL
jgi:hypothetical protein